MRSLIARLPAVVLALASGSAPAAYAHDFWIQPDSFIVPAGAPTALALLAGHGPERQRSPLPVRRITRFVGLTPLGQALDLRPVLRQEAAGTLGSARFGIPGAHLLALETDDRAQSHLPAARFNAYLRAEGLVGALEQRAGARLQGQDGAERYRRVAKALIQAGPAGQGGQDQASAELGLPLEIVLERSPYLLPRTTLLPVHVNYEGRALAGALVKLTNLDDDAAPVETQRTGTDGQASFGMPPPGRWLLNVVWTKPVNAADGIDFETVFSSYSFAVPE